tara:strand:- start:1050 stop:1208 length:159 start_codon:yes stop_codon:yes gene_type:complete
MVQVRPNGKTEKMLLVRTNVADADECCMFGKFVASHVGGEKAMKERKFETLQ